MALESQNDGIQGSDGRREVAYPVSLQVILPDGSAPRLWVVQRRRVQASEWRYDPNPDTASFVSGMSVRPVTGIPWTEENAAYFDDIAEEEGFPTATRKLITAAYPPEQELGRAGELISLAMSALDSELMPTSQSDAGLAAIAFANLDIQIVSVTTQNG